jgi:hypothetical protein
VEKKVVDAFGTFVGFCFFRPSRLFYHQDAVDETFSAGMPTLCDFFLSQLAWMLHAEIDSVAAFELTSRP